MQTSKLPNGGTIRHSWLGWMGSGEERKNALIITGLILGFVTAVGCSAAPPSPSPSTQEIRSDSDRFFNKLGQEEQTKETTQSAPERAGAPE